MAFVPPFCLVAGHRSPPVVAVGYQPVFSCDSKGQTFGAGTNQFRDGFTAPRNDYSLAFPNQLEKSGQLGLGLVDVHLHKSSLIHFLAKSSLLALPLHHSLTRRSRNQKRVARLRSHPHRVTPALVPALGPAMPATLPAKSRRM